MKTQQPKQHLHYQNICGTLVRTDGFLKWYCPDCGEYGESKAVLAKCPLCKSEKSSKSKPS